ncbi:NAD(P)H-binding protein [Streptococcus sp. DD12]|uniref:NAD(P)H-binding protein n=1 Tax=Streptococcus sp. DD12 TaxID=1777880 RepID=UPI0007989239|nr:NAD(P)H-binding protein [Streptococcus sp. DD12]KXT76807.1 Oxidoreductase [Streptococcus sp. DD12]
MKVFVAGATGRVAQVLIEDLLSQGHQVVAGTRQVNRLPHKEGLIAVTLELTSPIPELTKLLQGVDAVYFTAGSRGKELLAVDAFGAVALMQAAQLAGVKRFIMLSSLFSLTPEAWQNPKLSSLRDYLMAKYFADDWLMHRSGLDYTILQAGALEEAQEATGLVSFQVEQFSRNSIPNVAAVLAAVLTADNTIGKVIAMGDGEKPLIQAVKEV